MKITFAENTTIILENLVFYLNIKLKKIDAMRENNSNLECDIINH